MRIFWCFILKAHLSEKYFMTLQTTLYDYSYIAQINLLFPLNVSKYFRNSKVQEKNKQTPLSSIILFHGFSSSVASVWYMPAQNKIFLVVVAVIHWPAGAIFGV